MPSLALYHFDFCPFCRRVRQAIGTLDIPVALRNIHADSMFHDELREATGRSTVPCLRIEDERGEVTWMHESADIIEYLHTLTT